MKGDETMEVLAEESHFKAWRKWGKKGRWKKWGNSGGKQVSQNIRQLYNLDIFTIAFCFASSFQLSARPLSVSGFWCGDIHHVFIEGEQRRGMGLAP